jgi:hypothetical protein
MIAVVQIIGLLDEKIISPQRKVKGLGDVGAPPQLREVRKSDSM